jgi:aspartate aminotransferase-like enzyme
MPTTAETMQALTTQVLGHYAAEIHDASSEQLHHLDERFESQPNSPFILRVRAMVAAELTLRGLVGGAA